MNNGWYLLENGKATERVEYCNQNQFPSGSVTRLTQQGYTFTEVVVIPRRELAQGLRELRQVEFETCCGMLENHREFLKLESLASL